MCPHAFIFLFIATMLDVGPSSSHKIVKFYPNVVGCKPQELWPFVDFVYNVFFQLHTSQLPTRHCCHNLTQDELGARFQPDNCCHGDVTNLVDLSR